MSVQRVYGDVSGATGSDACALALLNSRRRSPSRASWLSATLLLVVDASSGGGSANEWDDGDYEPAPVAESGIDGPGVVMPVWRSRARPVDLRSLHRLVPAAEEEDLLEQTAADRLAETWADELGWLDWHDTGANRRTQPGRPEYLETDDWPYGRTSGPNSRASIAYTSTSRRRRHTRPHDKQPRSCVTSLEARSSADWSLHSSRRRRTSAAAQAVRRSLAPELSRSQSSFSSTTAAPAFACSLR